MQGWIRLYRKSIESSVFQNEKLWKVWTYCMMRANHKQTKILFNGVELTLLPGEFITGRFEGSKDCNMKQSTYRDQLNKLKSLGMVEIESDNRKSIIKVINWNQYQGNENFEKAQKSDSSSDSKKSTGSLDNKGVLRLFKLEPDSKPDIHPTTNRHRQECNNERISITHALQKYINDNYPRISKIKNQLTEEECIKLQEKYSKEEINETLDQLENYKKTTSQYTSVYLTLNNWIKGNRKRAQKFSPVIDSQFHNSVSLTNQIGVD